MQIVTLVVALFLLTACRVPLESTSAALEQPPEVESEIEQPESAVVAEELPDEAPPAAITEPAAEAASVSFEPRPHRAEPAPLDEFISDDAQYFAATGQAQLVEIFTFW